MEESKIRAIIRGGTNVKNEVLAQHVWLHPGIHFIYSTMSLNIQWPYIHPNTLIRSGIYSCVHGLAQRHSCGVVFRLCSALTIWAQFWC